MMVSRLHAWDTLRRDPIVLVWAAVTVALLAPYLVPLLSQQQMETYAGSYSDIPLILVAIAAFQFRLRRLPNLAERRFGTLMTLAFVCWLLVKVLTIVLPDAWYADVRSGVLLDAIYVAFYLFIVYALELRPHDPSRETVAGKLRSLRFASAVVLAFGLLVYFAIIPGPMNPEAYETWVTSLLLYVVLDVYLVIRLLYARHDSSGSHWKTVYNWLLATALLWMATDIHEALSYIGFIPYVRFGTVLDLAWFPAFFTVVVAARARELQFLSPTVHPASAPGEANHDMLRHSRGSLIGVYAVVLPTVHVALYYVGVLDPVSESAREICALFFLVLLAGMALLHQKLVEAQSGRLQAVLRLAVEGTASTSGTEFFRKLVRILADSLQTKFAFVSEVADAKAKRVRLLSFWVGTDYGETFEYETKDTPCEFVLSKGLRAYPARVQELFPNDARLREAGIQSYLAIPLYDSQGKPLGHLGVMHDEPMADGTLAESTLKIFAARAASEVERQQTELALRQGEHKYKSLINPSPDPIFVSRIDDFAFTEVNERACVNYGYSREEFLTMNIFDIEIDPPLPEYMSRAYREMDIGKVVEVDGINKRKDGSTFPVHVRFTKLDDEFALAVVRDVTERKQVEEALQIYKLMVSASSDLMAFVDPTYTYRAVNAAYYHVFGKTQEEILGHNVAWLLGQKVFETIKPKLDSCLAGEPMQFEFWWDSPILGVRHIDIRYDPFQEADGSISGVLVHIRDTTARQHTREELEKSRQRLRNLAARLHSVREEERAGLAREVHDELGQNLAALKMDLAWLTKRLPVDQGPLQAHARTMSSLIDSSLTTVRKIATRLRPPVLDHLGLTATIEWQTIEFAQRAEIRCELHLDTGEITLGNERDTELFRIFQEALANVGLHAEASHVHVTLRSSDGELVLVVSDDGRGISADQVENLESLGLIGMRERAEALSAKIEIQPQPEGGTRVTLTVPL